MAAGTGLIMAARDEITNMTNHRTIHSEVRTLYGKNARNVNVVLIYMIIIIIVICLCT